MKTRFFSVVFSTLLTTSAPIWASSQLDSILTSVSNLSDSAKTDSLIRLARQFIINEQAEVTIALSKVALEYAHQHKFKDLTPKARFYLAAGYDETLQFDSSLYHYKLALEEMKGTAHANWKVHVLQNISNYLGGNGSYDQALKYKLNVLAIAEEENDSLAIGIARSGIGYLYDRMKEFEESIRWQRKAIVALANSARGEYYKYLCYSRIGIAYDDLELFDSAHFYNKLGLEGMRKLEMKSDIPISLSNIGNTYSKQKKWKQAQFYLEEALRLNEDVGDMITGAIAAINLGYVYTERGKYKLAKQYIRLGKERATFSKEAKFIAEANYRLHQVFEKEGRLDSALFYYKAYHIQEDSLYGLERSKQIATLRTQYETDKKERQIAYQHLEIQEGKSALKARRNLNWVLVMALCLVLLIAIAFFYRFKTKKEAELQEVVIRQQEKGMRAIILAQEEERKRIAKDLHDGIGQQLSGLKMGLRNATDSLGKDQAALKDKMLQLNTVLSQSADEVRSISHQMMPRALTELGLISALEDMLNSSLGSSSIDFDFEHLNMENRLAESIEVSLYRVCQELINNVIKHSKASTVHVQLFQNKGKVIMIVEDNGKGIEKGKGQAGHGLMNIKSRLSTIHGEVNYEQSPSSGTLATVRIPL
jgi:signal transduction histidine kinase/tetratricopeptide (TPR) repeat protein